MRLIASDFDGTITSDNDAVEGYNRTAIRRWREAGNLFGVVTGRSISSVRCELNRRNTEVDFVVANTGAYIVCGDDVIHTAFIDGTIIPELVDYVFDTGGVGFHFCSDTKDYFPNFELFEEAKAKGITSWNGGFAEMADPEIVNLRRFLQFTVYYDLPEEEKLKEVERINRHFKGRIVAYPMIDCVKYGTDKAEGIEYVMKHYGLSHEECFAVGDYYNDIPMLEAYGSFAVAGAPDEVKKVAQRVAPSLGDAVDILLGE